MAIPHLQPADWPTVSPGRFASGIAREQSPPKTAAIALVGLPDDLGVRLNNGRAGAAQGPTAFRAALTRFGAGFDAVTSRAIPDIVWDAGDITPAQGADAAALSATHARVTEALLAVHRAGLLPVCIGGGHDLTFPAVRAFAQHQGGAVGGISIDPHLDVRETPGSGMPFRALIDGAHLDAHRFSVIGAGRFSNSREHIEWLAGRGGAIAPIEELARDPDAEFRAAMKRAGDHAFVSFDLDSIDGAFAPGVSAVNPAGLTPRESAIIVRAAGADPRVRHFDLMELNPAQDGDGRTARVAAFLFLNFVSAFAGRDQSP
jgi:formimidoylglutamase